ncbi:hypothetical protein [Haemophilus sp. SZY H8]|jgi:hypothetical protein|uniref:hypothetical protein n=1 Tax=Haemophilus sp. SZY H8 TaxID=2839031 RepID=UPI001C054DF2|nr:hypothetical protein [Haemophilus sp. SZY H8]
MKVQLVTVHGRNYGEFYVEEVNKFSSPKSFDMFDVNIIDLRAGFIYANGENKNDFSSIDCINDFLTMNNMIINSRKSKFLFIYPRNVQFITRLTYKEYQTPIKDITSQVSTLFSRLNKELDLDFYFERTDTKLSDTVRISADFYFPERDHFEILLRSIDSDKVTCCKKDNLFLTTLDILTDEELQLFLEKVGLKASPNAVAPDWMNKVMLFDDAEQLKKIEQNEAQIKSCKDSIAVSKGKLSENSRFKSILYTSGDELVDVVKDIFSKIFDVDFSGFKDKKKEDFTFTFKNKIFIGEIKGVNQNIKTTNLAQLDLHFTNFIEDRADDLDENNIHKLLVMNHQKDKDLKSRIPVDQQQIDMAKNKYESLIIETVELLEMYDKFARREMDQKECFDLICQNGILKLQNPRINRD